MWVLLMVSQYTKDQVVEKYKCAGKEKDEEDWTLLNKFHVHVGKITYFQ